MNLNATRRNARGLGTSSPYLMESLASAAPSKNAALPRRFVGMYHTNGVNPWKWYPTTAGREYAMPENLALLKDLREDPHRVLRLGLLFALRKAGHLGTFQLADRLRQRWRRKVPHLRIPRSIPRPAHRQLNPHPQPQPFPAKRAWGP